MKSQLLFLSFILISYQIIAQGTWITTPGTTSSRIDDISFINDSTGFYGTTYYNSILDSSVAGIFKTTDKGDTWNEIYNTSHITIRSIEFLNETLGFYGVLPSWGLTPGLYRTTDGGLTWNLTNIQFQPTDGICGIAHFGNRIIAVGTYAGPPYIYLSDDAGVNWTKTDLSALASGLVDCYMINHNEILVSGVADSTNQYKGTILKSTDGGLSWQRVFLASSIGMFNVSYCWKMFFHNNGLGLSSVTNGSAVARTTDYGNTWTEIYINNPFGVNLGAIGIINDTLGWTTDQHSTGTLVTFDGGLTWDSVTTSVHAGNRMVVIDSVTALIGGQNIYKYSAGLTYTEPQITGVSIHHTLKVFPNPALENISIEIIPYTSTFGTLDIFDSSGKLIKNVNRQVYAPGRHIFEVKLNEPTSGNYIVLWRTNEYFLSEDFIIAK